MKNISHRSPLFYVGDKYKLVGQIGRFFPKDIERFYEPFVGGGSVFMNVDAKEYHLNDFDKSIINIHLMLNSYCGREGEFFDDIFTLIRKYGLVSRHLGFSHCQGAKVDGAMLKALNSEGYYRMRKDFNDGGMKDIRLLYLMLIYGFNHMTRFNRKGEYNLPVGNLDFNKNTFKALNDYFAQIAMKHPQWYNHDFRTFLRDIDLAHNDFVYLDPPYLITSSQYNKMWDKECEMALTDVMNHLDRKQVRFAVSNVVRYKGRRNTIFKEWATQYNVHSISSNYKSYHDNSAKDIKEVLVTNY